ncbi:GNAT family N-acetyltransferase [Nostoc sp. CCY 9925]|uniref:GNAT family N-acetyltransferase n=1 Tax=Nostoc sp. CCY 9925 TaxID=3103865 RepID=UPI0039C5B998
MYNIHHQKFIEQDNKKNQIKMHNISFRMMTIYDATAISQLLLNSPEVYIKYFSPFDFQVSSIQDILKKAVKDKFFGVDLKSEYSYESELVGFYMLRGLDEGYCHPMYGVFISHQYSGKGIASLTIRHAELFCKVCNYEQLLLKVHSKNLRARKLYESVGFKFLREENLINNLVLYKKIQEI